MKGIESSIVGQLCQPGQPLRVGGVTFYVRKGRVCAQESRRPAASGKNWVMTPARERSLRRFRSTRLVSGYLATVYDGLPVWETAAAVAAPRLTGTNYRERVMSPYYDDAGFVRDFANLVVSEGRVLPSPGMRCEYADGVVTLRWEAGTESPWSRPTDTLHVFHVRESKPGHMGRAREVTATRGDGVARLELRVAPGDRLHVYPFFGRADRSGFSRNGHFCIEGPPVAGGGAAEGSVMAGAAGKAAAGNVPAAGNGGVAIAPVPGADGAVAARARDGGGAGGNGPGNAGSVAVTSSAGNEDMRFVVPDGCGEAVVARPATVGDVAINPEAGNGVAGRPGEAVSGEAESVSGSGCSATGGVSPGNAGGTGMILEAGDSVTGVPGAIGNGGAASGGMAGNSPVVARPPEKKGADAGAMTEKCISLAPDSSDYHEESSYIRPRCPGGRGGGPGGSPGRVAGVGSGGDGVCPAAGTVARGGMERGEFRVGRGAGGDGYAVQRGGRRDVPGCRVAGAG